MALKIQQLTPAATTLTAFTAVPAGKQWLWDINACNRGAAATVRLAVTVDATTTYYEYDHPLAASGVLERTGRKLPAGGVLKVWASTPDVDFTLDYVEE